MKGTLIALILVTGAGCASGYHARYESPNPPRVVVPAPAPGAVVVTPPPRTVTVQTAPSTVVVPAITENEAAEIARSEAYRHGWRNVGVDHARFWENHWEVEVYNHPHKAVEHHGWVDIAPDGSVLGFSTRHEHADYYRR
jgi:hypothetical protein